MQYLIEGRKPKFQAGQSCTNNRSDIETYKLNSNCTVDYNFLKTKQFITSIKYIKMQLFEIECNCCNELYNLITDSKSKYRKRGHEFWK